MIFEEYETVLRLIEQVMLQSRLWQKELDVALCWKFFKYKLVLNDSHIKFTRDKNYLEECRKLMEDQYVLDWNLPFDLTNVLARINYVMKDVNSLEQPLDQITTMITSLQMNADYKLIVSWE